MGRGRAKAKQTKIARELKYAGLGGDLAQLQAELQAALGTREQTHLQDPEPSEAAEGE
jgi:hypothetical protein